MHQILGRRPGSTRPEKMFSLGEHADDVNPPTLQTGVPSIPLLPVSAARRRGSWPPPPIRTSTGSVNVHGDEGRLVVQSKDVTQLPG